MWAWHPFWEVSNLKPWGWPVGGPGGLRVKRNAWVDSYEVGPQTQDMIWRMERINEVSEKQWGLECCHDIKKPSARHENPISLALTSASETLQMVVASEHTLLRATLGSWSHMLASQEPQKVYSDSEVLKASTRFPQKPKRERNTTSWDFSGVLQHLRKGLTINAWALAAFGCCGWDTLLRWFRAHKRLVAYPPWHHKKSVAPAAGLVTLLDPSWATVKKKCVNSLWRD